MDKKQRNALIAIVLIVAAIFILPKLGLFAISSPSGYTKIVDSTGNLYGGGDSYPVSIQSNGNTHDFWYYSFSQCVQVLNSFSKSKCTSGGYNIQAGSSISHEGSFYGDQAGISLSSASNECCLVTNQVWQLTQSCTSGNTCSSSEIGAKECRGPKIYTCNKLTNSLYCFQESFDCQQESGQTCSNGACASSCQAQSNICSLQSRVCGPTIDQCGNDYNCGTCPSGKSCNSNGACVTGGLSTCVGVGGQCHVGTCQTGTSPYSGGALDCTNGYTIDINDYCCVSTGTNGTLSVGSSCILDTQCASNHCDKNRWYSLSSTCQPIPWGEVKKIALTRETIKDMTTPSLVAIACVNKSECIPPDSNYSSKCIPLSQLKADGTIGVTTGFFDTAKSAINGAAIGVGVGGVVGIAACIGTGAIASIFLTPAAGAVVFSTVCASAIPGGAYIGAAVGAVNSNNAKDPLVKALNANDETSVGLCVASPQSAGGSWCSISSNLAFFSMTGDKCTDGSIILGIIVLFGIILVTRL